MNHAGLARVWREMLKRSARYIDAGDVTEVQVTEHTPRRAGSQFHARRGLKLWQIQCIGRWAGNTVERYVGEAFADIRAGWSMSSGTSAVPKVPRRSVDDTQRCGAIAEAHALSAGGGGFEVVDCHVQGADGWYAALDLEEEAAEDKSWPISATSVASLLCKVQAAHAINGRTRMAHAVDLSGFR